ncbi:hypothetical protein [Roseibium sp. TrichSKD4]|uniref:hypothetical protein n=1 Tax=Roseibium sp. TrichSKD4 TaxID=744980 RepID=UPI00058B07A5|nr:hypothetical protein [Roseibium sp. TrichSKD4]
MAMDRDNLRFNILRNALYHTACLRLFDRFNKVLSFLVVILGAGAMSDLSSEFGIDLIYIGALIATVGSIQLVFDLAGRARTHQQLQKDYYYLLADIEGQLDGCEDACAKWQAQMIRITASEPPTLRAIDAKAYNDALDATGIYPAGERLIIPWWQSPLASVLSFEGYTYRKQSECGAVS